MTKTGTLIVLLFVLGGCGGTTGKKALPAARPGAGGRELLSVDFKKDQVLRYKFVSSRNIAVDWGRMQKGSQKTKSKVDKSSESLEMVVDFRAIDVKPYALNTVKATCKSMKIVRSANLRGRGSGTDAAGLFKGKSWTLKVGPTGRIEDACDLYDLLRQAGKKAIRPNRSQGAVKDPDMLYDVIALQWFLWDSISSVVNSSQGVAVGDEWHSMLPIPAPMILWPTRDVTYKLAQISESEKGRLAIIESTFAPGKTRPQKWPVPYSEPFQMAGMFGFLRGYKVLGLEGTGRESFNIDSGRTEGYKHKYKLQLRASLPMGLGVHPKITIDQTLQMEFVEPKTAVNSR